VDFIRRPRSEHVPGCGSIHHRRFDSVPARLFASWSSPRLALFVLRRHLRWYTRRKRIKTPGDHAFSIILAAGKLRGACRPVQRGEKVRARAPVFRQGHLVAHRHAIHSTDEPSVASHLNDFASATGDLEKVMSSTVNSIINALPVLLAYCYRRLPSGKSGAPLPRDAQ